MPKKLNTCPSQAVIVPNGNTPAGVVPSPLRRSVNGRTPFLPNRAVITAVHCQPDTPNSAICNVPALAGAAGAITTTTWLAPACA